MQQHQLLPSASTLLSLGTNESQSIINNDLHHFSQNEQNIKYVNQLINQQQHMSHHQVQHDQADSQHHSASEYSCSGQPPSKKPRLVFTDIQRRTLQAIFKETKRPSKEMQVTIAQQLGLEVTTVSNFFMNARRRSMDKWKDQLDDDDNSNCSSLTK